MLIYSYFDKPQQHQDSLFFKNSPLCDIALKILTNNCLHLRKRGEVLFLDEDDIKKLEALQPLIRGCSLSQIQNISKSFSDKPKDSILKLLIKSFDKNCGWFFKNGNK